MSVTTVKKDAARLSLALKEFAQELLPEDVAAAFAGFFDKELGEAMGRFIEKADARGFYKAMRAKGIAWDGADEKALFQTASLYGVQKTGEGWAGDMPHLHQAMCSHLLLKFCERHAITQALPEAVALLATASMALDIVASGRDIPCGKAPELGFTEFMAMRLQNAAKDADDIGMQVLIPMKVLVARAGYAIDEAMNRLCDDGAGEAVYQALTPFRLAILGGRTIEGRQEHATILPTENDTLGMFDGSLYGRMLEMEASRPRATARH